MLFSVALAALFAAGALSASAELGSAVLSWTAPTTDEGGGALTGLAGYNVYYDTVSHAGTCPSGYASNVDTQSTDTDYAFDDLTVGLTYYFQVTAYDEESPYNESDCSTAPGEVSKLVSYRGDINSTGISLNTVDALDLSSFADDWLQAICGPVNKADINRDCVVDALDLSLLGDDFGKSFAN